MVSVLQVYTALKDLANKEQKGFITPQVFNSFAALAQMNVYNEMFSELVDAKRLSRQNFEPGRDKSVRKQKKEDLSYFLAEMQITVANGIADKPSDLSKIISMSVGDDVAKEVVRNNYVEALWRCDHVNGRGVDVHVVVCDLRVFFRDLFD